FLFDRFITSLRKECIDLLEPIVRKPVTVVIRLFGGQLIELAVVKVVPPLFRRKQKWIIFKLLVKAAFSRINFAKNRIKRKVLIPRQRHEIRIPVRYNLIPLAID